MQRLQRDHRGHHIGGHTRAAPSSRKQVREHLIGKQLPPVRGQEPEHAARLEEMPRHRLGVKNLPLIIRAPLHPKIIPTTRDQTATATRNYSGVS